MHSEALFSKGLGHVPFMNLDLGSILKYGLGLINDENYQLTMKVISDFLFDQITCEKREVTPTGIKNTRFADLSFYPNPIGDNFQITMPEAKSWQVQIFDLSGKMILQNNFQGIRHTQTTQQIHAGLYVIQVFDVNAPEKVFTGKITK
ncbi:MAG: T9SS type A sorting domain-containing protein [Chitinophagales bacterium]|nr:T9SS type A sorting domain-containing protein [Chitinophagales bacterium]